MAVGMRMARPVRMYVLVLMENDGEPSSKGIGNATERPQTRDVIAPLQARNHRFSHPQARRELPLGLAGVGAKLEELLRAARGELLALVEDCPMTREGLRAGIHGFILSKIANNSILAKMLSDCKTSRRDSIG